MDRQHNAHTKRKIHVGETSTGLVITNTIKTEPINIIASIISTLALLTTFYIQFQIITIIFGIDDTPTFVYVFLGLILVFLLYCQKIVLGLALFSILNKEIIECSNQQITVRKKWELSTKKSYNTSKIYKTEFDKPIYKGLFMQKYKSNYYKPLHKNISFRYGLEIMTFGVDVSESEANYILNTLVEKGILKQEQVKI